MGGVLSRSLGRWRWAAEGHECGGLGIFYEVLDRRTVLWPQLQEGGIEDLAEAVSDALGRSRCSCRFEVDVSVEDVAVRFGHEGDLYVAGR
jgi:hypothetical protein